MATYNQNIVDSYGELAEATTQQNTAGSKAGESFSEGFDLVTTQIDKNRKESQEKEDRAYMLKKRARDEDLAEMDYEKKNMMYQAEKGETFKIIDDGIESGLLKAADYSGYQNNREAWWKDQANQLKLYEDIGDKASFRTRISSAIKGEEAWSGLAEGSKGLSISDSSGEAQNIDLAIDRWHEKSPDSAPPIITKGGIDYFEIPNADGSGTVQIAVDKVASGDPSKVYGDYEEPITVEGVRTSIGDDPVLGDMIRGQYANDEAVKNYLRQKVSSPEGELDKIKLKEVVNSLALDGLDLQDYDVVDTNNDGEINKDDITLANLEEVFFGMIEGEFGKQDKQKPLTQAEKLKIQNLRLQQENIRNKGTSNSKTSTKEVKVLADAYDDFINTNSTASLKNRGDILDVYQKPVTDANGNPTGEQEWFISTQNKGVISAGNAGVPNGDVVKGALGLDVDHKSTKPEQGPSNQGTSAFDQYYTT